ncbi:flavin adenine dinucleotide synthase [Trichomonascus vanleenenianus]|uniref:FMN adenylyltransferase n=1 Tax=Trichomonascus vanleenenianus TaxID=2268995 RepID=UPI003ECB772F
MPPLPGTEELYDDRHPSPTSILQLPHHPSEKMTVSLRESCAKCSRIIDEYLSAGQCGLQPRSHAQKQVELSLAIMESTFQKHPLREIALSFNGGKDCLVMLVIFLAALDRQLARDPDYLDGADRVSTVYVHFEHTFPEVDEFVNQCKIEYALDVIRIPPPLKTAFTTYLEQRPEIKAILVGIRRTDPYGENLVPYERTDHGWPDFIRVHPVLEWHFAEIWDFLRCANIPYCSLYDQGYTSLGSITNTRKNPTLELDKKDANGDPIYMPAYVLTDDNKERLSRVK